MARDTQDLTRRIADALSRRSPLKDLPIGVQTRDGVATLSGKVPSAYEAMLAYRTVEQTPGVRDMVDQLTFQVPDENHPNPLRQKGRPEDVEPYLSAQIRRHLGDLAHVDRVRIRGEIVEIRGTLTNAGDRDRIAAILRSIPLLRDFRVEPEFRLRFVSVPQTTSTRPDPHRVISIVPCGATEELSHDEGPRIRQPEVTTVLTSVHLSRGLLYPIFRTSRL